MGRLLLKTSLSGDFIQKTLYVESGDTVGRSLRFIPARGSLDAHLYGCIIQRTYGFGLAPLARGKLFQDQEWE